ncbi:MAG: hypothetical protein U0228_28175 [Myxococcaceae bacterium]
MHAWLLLTAVSLAEVDPDVAARRERPRLHAAIGLGVTTVFGGRTRGVVPSVSAELGITLVDRSRLSLRLHLGTNTQLTGASLGLAVDTAVSDRWRIGFSPALGAAGTTTFGRATSWVLLLGGVEWALTGRDDRDTRPLRGLRLFVEAGPGVVMPFSPPIGVPAFSGTMGIVLVW